MASNFSKRFNPSYAMKMSQMKRVMTDQVKAKKKKKKGRLSDEANEGAQLDHPGPSLCAGAFYQHLIGPLSPIIR